MLIETQTLIHAEETQTLMHANTDTDTDAC